MPNDSTALVVTGPVAAPATAASKSWLSKSLEFDTEGDGAAPPRVTADYLSLPAVAPEIVFATALPNSA